MANYQYSPYDYNKLKGPLTEQNFPQQQVNSPMQGFSNMANMYARALYSQQQNPGTGTQLQNPFSPIKSWASGLFTQPPATGSDTAIY